MSSDFFVAEERLATVKATAAGRKADGGYNYQRAYAIARLAAMCTSQSVLGLRDYPKRLRYDWAEDVDEVLDDDSACFTQCKRVDDIGEPANLAQILLNFAPKWLWIPEAKRAQVRFRIVSSDPRFLYGFNKDAQRVAVLAKFKAHLAAIPSPQLDRAKWQSEADKVGHEQLFDAVWEPLDFIYLAKGTVSNDAAGSLLLAERAALDHLMQWNVIWGGTQEKALDQLRRLLNENLIAFDETKPIEPHGRQHTPQTLRASDVRVALFAKAKDAQPPPFTVVDRIHLAKARMIERKRFLFEAPEWHHVVHGADEQLKFVERDQTELLAQTVRERLIAPLLRGTGALSTLFVTGPPGAGKSTLVRRVAAQLVEAGEVVVADAGHNLANTVPGGIERYVQHLTKLAQEGIPLLLVLDDPLTAESEWIELLKDLKQPGLQLTVITPTPDFLYYTHQHELRGLFVHTFPVNPPSASEKQALSRLYGHTLNPQHILSDDFLVAVAEAAEGKPFPEIMVRLWTTLNGGQGISGTASFKELPWPVRAFWFVCAVHRTYTPCPLPILQAALDISGGTDRLNVGTALVKLKAEGGWSIFQIRQPVIALMKAAGELVSTAHQKIASVAWEKRPAAWLDHEVDQVLAASTLRAAGSVVYVAAAAGALAAAAPKQDFGLAEELIRQWERAARLDPKLETRHLCSFAANLGKTGGRALVQRMSVSLGQRTRGRDGWLAALQLRFHSADKEPQRSFPSTINLSRLIADANFALAPNRATQFFEAVKETKNRETIISQLYASLDGRLSWELDPTLLVWLISHARPRDIIRRLDQLQKWFKRHQEDFHVRTRYLAFIQHLPPEFDDLREQVVDEIANWLDQHKDDTSLRAQYLIFLTRLPHAFVDHCKNAATATQNWLDTHKEDRRVRTQYLAFLIKLPDEFAGQRKAAVISTRNWLDEHKEDTQVRTQYLAFLMKLPDEFASQRKDAAISIANWLDEHKEDTEVRTQYLAFLMKLPGEFAGQRMETAISTANWLDIHEDDTSVRTQYLAFVQHLPAELDELRKQAALKTAAWLEAHPGNIEVCEGYLSLLLALRHPDLASLEAESIAFHQWIIDKNPKQVGYRFVFGEQLLRLEKYVEAKAEFEKVLVKEPGHQLAHRGLGRAWQNLGEPLIAEREFKNALHWAKENRGNLARFHTSLGVFYLTEKRWAEAIQSFGEAAEECPDYYGNHWGIAKAYSELGQLHEAIRALQQALADPGLTSPTREEIEHMLADISQRVTT
jgi:hypothetical protein